MKYLFSFILAISFLGITQTKAQNVSVTYTVENDEINVTSIGCPAERGKSAVGWGSSKGQKATKEQTDELSLLITDISVARGAKQKDQKGRRGNNYTTFTAPLNTPEGRALCDYVRKNLVR